MCPRRQEEGSPSTGGGQGQWCSGKAAPALGSDLLHWLLLHVLRIPDKREHRLLAHLPEVVGPQGQGLGVNTAGSQALGSGYLLLTFDPDAGKQSPVFAHL